MSRVVKVGERRRLYLSFSAGAIQRPRFRFDRHEKYVSLSWGNRWSDPVWSISYEWWDLTVVEDGF